MEDWLTDWISNPTSILAAIAVIALLWHGARWTQRMEAGQQTLRDGLKDVRDGLKELRDGLKELGDRMDAQRALLEERIEKESRTLRDEVRSQRALLEERIEKESRTLRDEVRSQQSETRGTLDTLLLRVGGTERAAAGSSPLRLTEFGKRIEAELKPGKWVRRHRGAASAGNRRARTVRDRRTLRRVRQKPAGQGVAAPGRAGSLRVRVRRPGPWATSSASCCATRCWRLRTPDRTRRKPPD